MLLLPLLRLLLLLTPLRLLLLPLLQQEQRELVLVRHSRCRW
jgi:hypothetical protein